jgi:hypothetical protein
MKGVEFINLCCGHGAVEIDEAGVLDAIPAIGECLKGRSSLITRLRNESRYPALIKCGARGSQDVICPPNAGVVLTRAGSPTSWSLWEVVPLFDSRLDGAATLRDDGLFKSGRPCLPSMAG